MFPRRAFWFSLALVGWGLASLGCTDLLGLDELTFDKAVDAGTNSEAGVGLGGDGDSSFVDEHRFPARLGPMKVVIGRPDAVSDAPYVVYDPASGQVESHRIDVLRNRYELIASWDWEPDWSLVYQVPLAEGSMLVGYDGELGLSEHVPTDDDVTRQRAGELLAGTPGWTDVVPIETSEGWQDLAFNQNNGHYRFGRALVDSPDDSEVRTGTWLDRWTLLVAHPLEQGAAVLKYDTDTGDAELEQLSGSAEEIGNTWRGSLGTGWTSIVSLPTEAEVVLLLYEADLGRVTTGTLRVSDTLSFLPLETAVWREGISHVVPMWLGSAPHALTYSEETGIVELRMTSPLESPPVSIY